MDDGHQFNNNNKTLNDGHQFNNNNKTLNILCCEQDPKRPQSSRHAKPPPVGQIKGHETVSNKNLGMDPG